ncbi:MAG: sugar phosphate nucleotidyltransferase [Candidatus Melainabacteria bacterium]|nr:sugar phosphate nucleotidyltransferase [Candidatus Melainabacteria bacterium]
MLFPLPANRAFFAAQSATKPAVTTQTLLENSPLPLERSQPEPRMANPQSQTGLSANLLQAYAGLSPSPLARFGSGQAALLPPILQQTAGPECLLKTESLIRKHPHLNSTVIAPAHYGTDTQDPYLVLVSKQNEPEQALLYGLTSEHIRNLGHITQRQNATPLPEGFSIKPFQNKGKQVAVELKLPEGLRIFTLPGGSVQSKQHGLDIALTADDSALSTEAATCGAVGCYTYGPQKTQALKDILLLCAGKNTRCEPLIGNDTGFSKPAVVAYEAADGSGAISFAHEMLRDAYESGLSNVFYNVYTMPQSVEADLQQAAKHYAGLTLSEINESQREKPTGTAGPLLELLQANRLKGNVAIAATDAICHVPWADVEGFHQAKQADVTIVTSHVPTQDLLGKYGTVLADEQGRVLDFKEKPKRAEEVESNQINTSIYLVDQKAYPAIQALLEYADSQGIEKDFGNFLFPAVIDPKQAVLQQAAQYFQTHQQPEKAEALRPLNVVAYDLKTSPFVDAGDLYQMYGVIRDIYQGHVPVSRQVSAQQKDDHYDRGVLYNNVSKREAQPILEQYGLHLNGNVLVMQALPAVCEPILPKPSA